MRKLRKSTKISTDEEEKWQGLARLLARGVLRLASELTTPVENKGKSPESALSSAHSGLLYSGKRGSLSNVVNDTEI